MKATDLQRAQTLMYEIDDLEQKVATLTTAYLTPAPKDTPHKTYIIVDDMAMHGRFPFLMTEPVYFALKGPMEESIAIMKKELADIGVEL